MAPDALPPDRGAAPALEALVDPASICRISQVRTRMETYPVYRTGMAWLHDFIMREHPDLRRPGAVCPFVQQGETADVITLAVRSGPQGGASEAFALLRPLGEAFRAMEPRSGALLGLKSLIVFFPDLPEAQWADFIDGGHRLAKPWLVDRGLMLGEFHPASEVPGASNPAFRAMRAPVPAFVLREMALHDTKFITYPDEAPERRAGYLRAYIEHVAPRVPPKVRREAERLLREVEAEIAGQAAD